MRVVRRVLAPAAISVTLALVTVVTASAQEEAQPPASTAQPVSDARWNAVVDRIVAASETTAYVGRVVIVAFDDAGPTLVELDVEHGAQGGLRVGHAETWMIGRQGEDAFFWKAGTGALLLGDVEATRWDARMVATKYEVHALGTETLVTGDAQVIELREHDTTSPRERLFVDEATDLVTRRVTFDANGRPERLVAFTSLLVTSNTLEAPATSADDADGHERFKRVSSGEFTHLRDSGWIVPTELPAGFGLRSGYAASDDAASLHLVYTDGVYTMSIYEQRGTLDIDGLADGAVGNRVAGMHVYRWPGSEPERLVWSAEGMTYTVIADAPADQLMAAVQGLPHDAGPSAARRLVRGLARVGSWVWPFG